LAPLFYPNSEAMTAIFFLSGNYSIYTNNNWSSGAESLRSAFRWFDEPFGMGGGLPYEIDFGFRIVRNAQ